MNLLFYIEPLVMHSRPFHYWAWLDLGSVMGRGLAETGEWNVRWAMNHALATRAVPPRRPGERANPRRTHGLPREQVVLFAQEEIRELYDAPNSAIVEGLHHGRWPADRIARHARLLRERLDGFVPDVVITWTASAALREAFPDALVLHTEVGAFSRPPYPAQVVLDPAGCFGHSLLGAEAAAIRTMPSPPEDVAAFRRMRDALARHHAATTVFAGTERRLRERFRTLALLPLQFGGEFGFDSNGPFRNQGEYLFHVLERIPADVGLLVTHHPTSLWVGDRIDEETQEYLAGACPQAIFVPPGVAANAGQMLVPHVDSVISVSSSLGLQAAFWGKRLIAPGWSHLREWADSGRIEDLAEGALPPPADRDAAFAWLMRHYWMDIHGAHDGPTLHAHLAGMLARHRAGARGLALLADSGALERYETAVLRSLPELPEPIEVSGDWLDNGRLEGRRNGTPDGWRWLSGAGADQSPGSVDGPNEGPAFRLERRDPGTSGTVLYQRLADLRKLAGAFVTVRFLARGSDCEAVSVYFYQQFGTQGSPARGTDPGSFAVGPEWQEFRYTVTIPAVGDAKLGAGHHTELAFLFPPSLPNAWIELACVTLESGSLV